MYGLHITDMETTWLLVDIAEPLSHSTLKLALLMDSLSHKIINVLCV